MSTKQQSQSMQGQLVDHVKDYNTE